jgi:hypothetical protein
MNKAKILSFVHIVEVVTLEELTILIATVKIAEEISVL